MTGFEPATPWSQTRCATNCATPRITVFICSSSSHHPGLDTTPRDCLFCLSVVGVTGFEPATPWSQTRCATNCATPRNCSFQPATSKGSGFRFAKIPLFFYTATLFAIFFQIKSGTLFKKCAAFYFFSITIFSTSFSSWISPDKNSHNLNNDDCHANRRTCQPNSHHSLQ